MPVAQTQFRAQTAGFADARQQAAQALNNMPKRPFFRLMPWLIGGAAMVIGSIPIVGAAAGPISFVGDWLRTGDDRKYELRQRTHHLRDQIAKELNISPQEVSDDSGKKPKVHLFKKAAEQAAKKGNPRLKQLYDEPARTRGKELRGALITSAAVSAAGSVAMGAVGEGAKQATRIGVKVASHGAGMLAGGAINSVLSHDVVEVQPLMEAIERSIHEADLQGIPRNQVVNPDLIFTMRVAQDPVLAKRIRSQHKKPFHKMTTEERQELIAKEPDLQRLMRASQRDAVAIVNRDKTILDVAHEAPNMEAGLSDSLMAGRQARPSMVDMVEGRRAAAAAAAKAGPAPV